MDLKRSSIHVDIDANGWSYAGEHYPYLERCKERTVYYWTDSGFEPVSRYSTRLVKLVPTEWGPPTFEIDGIKMLPTAHVSPYADAERKVGLIEPRGKVILDTCGGLGYFAAWCLHSQATQIVSFEKNLDVIWLRSLNPWSPSAGGSLHLENADVLEAILSLPENSVDAVLHDPPRFSIAGELYSQHFYTQLARVLKPKGRLFHYTGSPNSVSSGRDLAAEVSRRLRKAGLHAQVHGDGLFAVNASTKRGLSTS